jgi:AraC-like DNA-binding protein
MVTDGVITPDTLVRVAAEVGFAHPSHLAAQFRRIVGVTPARFRGAV